MFDHVYCLQPSAADNPWLNKLLVIPWGSEEECPHLFRNDFPVKKAPLWAIHKKRKEGEREVKKRKKKEKTHSDVTNDILISLNWK